MERKSKLSISLTLSIIAMLLIVSLTGRAYAPEPPFPIGDPIYMQAESFDSNPTTGSYTGVGTPTGVIGNAFDGDPVNTQINWMYGGGADGVVGNVEVSDFKAPSDNGLTDFTITWLDIKVSYKATATLTSDDRYRIIAYVSGKLVVLLDWVDGVAGTAKYDPGTGTQGSRVFSKVTEPNNGVWDWTDVRNLMVMFECLRVGTNNFVRVYLYEVWVTAYSTPFPEGAGVTLTAQPRYILGLPADSVFYVDIYITNVNYIWGYQVVIYFDPEVVACMDYMTYGPFVTAKPSEIGPDYVSVAYGTYEGDPDGFNPEPNPPWHTPVCRIWFYVYGGGEGWTWLEFDIIKSQIANVYGAGVPFTSTNGYFNSRVPEFPLGLGIVMLVVPAIPVVYLWRIRKKERA